MEEEEFVALLAIEGRKLIVDRVMSHGNYKNNHKPVPYYSAFVYDLKDKVAVGCTSEYRSRDSAIKKIIKIYYADHRE